MTVQLMLADSTVADLLTESLIAEQMNRMLQASSRIPKKEALFQCLSLSCHLPQQNRDDCQRYQLQASDDFVAKNYRKNDVFSVSFNFNFDSKRIPTTKAERIINECKNAEDKNVDGTNADRRKDRKIGTTNGKK